MSIVTPSPKQIDEASTAAQHPAAASLGRQSGATITHEAVCGSYRNEVLKRIAGNGSFKQPTAQNMRHHMHAVSCAGFHPNILDVVLDRARRDAERSRNLLARQAKRYQMNYFTLSFGQIFSRLAQAHSSASPSLKSGV